MNKMSKSPGRDGDDRWVDQMLDDLARAPVPDLPDTLMARILADADAMLPPPGGRAARTPWWQQILEGVGGWTAVTGLVAAAATGFVVGLGALDGVGVTVPWMQVDDTYYDTDDATYAFGWDMEEG
jgi:hypothetical protein